MGKIKLIITKEQVDGIAKVQWLIEQDELQLADIMFVFSDYLLNCGIGVRQAQDYLAKEMGRLRREVGNYPGQPRRGDDRIVAALRARGVQAKSAKAGK